MTPKRTHRRPPDIADLTAALESPEDEVRLRALKQACPCRSGFVVYEHLRRQIQQLQKDPDLAIRRAARHIVQEACEIEQKETRLDEAEHLGIRPGDADWTTTQTRRRATQTWQPL